MRCGAAQRTVGYFFAEELRRTEDAGIVLAFAPECLGVHDARTRVERIDGTIYVSSRDRISVTVPFEVHVNEVLASQPALCVAPVEHPGHVRETRRIHNGIRRTHCST